MPTPNDGGEPTMEASESTYDACTDIIFGTGASSRKSGNTPERVISSHSVPPGMEGLA